MRQIKGKPSSIVVRCPNWVGDLIMATPVFQSLRRGFPDAALHAVTRPYNREIISDCPWLTSVIPCDDQSLQGMRSTAGRIREVAADWAILLPNSIRSYLPVRLAGVRQVFGYRRGVRKPLVQGPEPWRASDGRYLPLPMIDYYLEICRWLGLEVPSHPKPALFIAETLRQDAARLLAKYGIGEAELVIGLNPGAKFGSSKCWPPEYFARLADMLEERLKAKLLLFVGPGEGTIAEKIMGATEARLIDTGPDEIGLGLLKPMIQRCDLLITNDTGPRHYATALDRPVVVIMGPTDSRYTDANLEKTIVLRKHLSCSPCHKKTCTEGHACMKDILPEEVMDAASRLLRREREVQP